MCIIIVKDIGVKLPSDKIMDTCWQNNSDGAGFMYLTKDKQVHICKGFMTFADLNLAILERGITKADLLVIHFRLATSGIVNQACTHPFPLSKKNSELRQLDIVCKKGVVHNGVFGVGKKKMSDTMLFVKEILSDGVIHNNLSRPAIKNLLAEYLGTTRHYSNKLAILGKTGVKLLGEDWEYDSDSRLYFSNIGYQYVVPAYPHKKDNAHTRMLDKDSSGCDWDDEYSYCEACGETFILDPNIRIESQQYCYDCEYGEEEFLNCIDCGSRYPLDPNLPFNGQDYCVDCWINRLDNEQYEGFRDKNGKQIQIKGL